MLGRTLRFVIPASTGRASLTPTSLHHPHVRNVHVSARTTLARGGGHAASKGVSHPVQSLTVGRAGGVGMWRQGTAGLSSVWATPHRSMAGTTLQEINEVAKRAEDTLAKVEEVTDGQIGNLDELPALPFTKIAVIGGGVMSNVVASRIVAGTGEHCPEMAVYDVNEKQAKKMAKLHPKFKAVKTCAEALEGAQVILLAVKPQNIPSVAKELKNAGDSLSPDATVLSVLAGTRVDTLIKALKLKKIVRAMPNTPCALGMGITVWLSSPAVTKGDLDGITTIFEYMGESVEVKDESFIDMATAVAGSGPAFVYMAMEAMVDAGVQMGLPRPTAVKLVQNTFQGTGAYALHSPRHLAQLRNDITSPGGTTATAMHWLEKGGMRSTLSEAVFAARAKAVELSRGGDSLPDGMASKMSDDSF
eukprot:m.102849 g.102849  ORF g.102849 m.102849 type:complete len:418 (-) comp10451_c0_seq2:154-1407(-)